MFLSKIWFVLVALVAGVAMTAAFVAPRSADRRIVELEGQRLDRAQYAAEQMLKTDAHWSIDYASKLARDAVLSEALDSASKGAGEARMLSETVRNRFRALVPDLAGAGIDGLTAVDAKGRVVARVGEKESESGDAVGGLEVVADALPRLFVRRRLGRRRQGAAGGRGARACSKGRDRIVARSTSRPRRASAWPRCRRRSRRRHRNLAARAGAELDRASSRCWPI